MVKTKHYGKGVTTDTLLINTFNCLISDFQRELNTTLLEKYRVKSVRSAHELEWPSYGQTSVEVFKRYYQLEKFFSRYTARSDVFTPMEVESMTLESLRKDTCYAAQQLQNPWKLSTTLIMREARRIAKQILGPLDKERWFSLCRFGRRASKDVPRSNSYLHIKASFPISCSSPITSLFEDYLGGDTLLGRVMGTRRMTTLDSRYNWYESLDLSLVPKKFDKLRPITPYTTVSCFLATGLGEYIRECLKDQAGLDLSRLQAIHREMVLEMSKNRQRVTTDMKAASTLITSRHVRTVLPYEWYKILHKFHVSYLTHEVKDGSKNEVHIIKSNTFGGMGCGFTFPLQTLIFYCVISAIRNLAFSGRGYVSVYGDDLIYSYKLHKYVLACFEDIGFVVNKNKTFADEFFRESCGEDAYHGVSVRPFSYEGGTERLFGNRRAAFLYKILNGLLARWKEKEIPSTCNMLRAEIIGAIGQLYLVPPYFPDYSGEKTSDPDTFVEWYVPVSRPAQRQWRERSLKAPGFYDGKPGMGRRWITTWQFKCLGTLSPHKLVTIHYPYVWDSLRSKTQTPQDETYWLPEDSTVLSWEKHPNKHKTVTSKVTGRTYRKKRAWVAEKQKLIYAETSGSTCEWLVPNSDDTILNQNSVKTDRKSVV